MSDLRPVEVDAEGDGASRDAAVSKALANGVSQATGLDVAQVSLNASADAFLSSHQTDHLTGPDVVAGSPRHSQRQPGEGTHTDDLAENAHGQLAANAVLTFSGGRIARYTITSIAAIPNGGFLAKVHAVLQLYRRAPSAADLRKSIAVTSIDSGDKPSLGSDLHDQLVIDLTQANRFAVVDRSHDLDYQNEIALVQSTDASPEARAHAGQALGADFILTGRVGEKAGHTIGHAARVEVNTIELTGERVSQTTASTLHTIPGTMSAEFQVIELATRQIVLADRLELKGTSIEEVAQHITDELIGTIYPPRLLRSDDPTAMVISQGGSGMHPGLRFRLMSEGAEMFDPYTHESLGRTERASGTVEITDVEPRLSYAKLVDGAIPPENDVVLRPVAPPPAELKQKHPRVRHSAPAAAEDDQPAGGVRLPGDQ